MPGPRRSEYSSLNGSGKKSTDAASLTGIVIGSIAGSIAVVALFLAIFLAGPVADPLTLKTLQVTDSLTVNGVDLCPDSKSAQFREVLRIPNLVGNTDPNQFVNPTYDNRGLSTGDPAVAVGPKTVIFWVNAVLVIRDKDTQHEHLRISNHEFFNLWNPVDQAASRGYSADVWVVWDEFHERFWLITLHPWFQPSDITSHLHLAVSKTATPKARSDFYFYNYTVPDFVFPDYPKLAVDKEAVYVTTNDFAGAGYAFNLLTNSIAVFDKTPLMTGTSSYNIAPYYKTSFAPTVPEVDGGSEEFMFPIQPTKGDGVERVVLAQIRTLTGGPTATSRTVRLNYFSNPIGATVLHYVEVTVPQFDFTTEAASFPPQKEPQKSFFYPNSVCEVNDNCTAYPSFPRCHLGSCTTDPANVMADVSGRINTGAIHSGSLWLGHSELLDGERSLPRWYEMDVKSLISSNTATLIQAGRLDTEEKSSSCIMPSLRVDNDGHMLIQCTLVGPTKYPTMAYTGRLASDPAGTLRLPMRTVTPGNLYYQGYAIRWGDYSYIALDTDGKRMWVYNMNPVEFDAYKTYPSTGLQFYPFGVNWMTSVVVVEIHSNCSDTHNSPQEYTTPLPTIVSRNRSPLKKKNTKPRNISDEPNLGKRKEMVAQKWNP